MGTWPERRKLKVESLKHWTEADHFFVARLRAPLIPSCKSSQSGRKLQHSLKPSMHVCPFRSRPLQTTDKIAIQMPSLSRGLCAQVRSFSNMPLSHSPLPVRIICGHVQISRHMFSTIPQLHAKKKTKAAAPKTKAAAPKPKVTPRIVTTPVIPKPTVATPKSVAAAPKPVATAPKPIAAAPQPAAAAPSPKRPTIPSQTPLPSGPYVAPPSPVYAAQLAQKTTPTLLYEAPNHFWFTFSAFNAGAFCMAYTAVQYYSVYLHPPPDLAWWVPHAYGLICLTMGAVGTYWLRWPSRIIRSITALPTPDRNFQTLKLEVSTRRLLPFLPWRKTVVPMHEFTVPAKVTGLIAAATRRKDLPQDLTEREKLILKQWEEEKKKAERQYELDHIMTAPFRHAGRGMKTALSGMMRALTRDGFANVMVGKAKYKIDAKSGWFLDEGKALERLVRVKDEEATGLEKMIRG